MIQFRDNGNGRGRLYDSAGRSVHTTRHVPRERRLFGYRWPTVVTFKGKVFSDAGRRDAEGYRAYCEVPEIATWGEW